MVFTRVSLTKQIDHTDIKRKAWLQADHTLDNEGLWFQADHTLDHIWFQIDHCKIMEKLYNLYGAIYDQSMINLVGNPGE